MLNNAAADAAMISAFSFLPTGPRAPKALRMVRTGAKILMLAYFKMPCQRQQIFDLADVQAP